MTERDRAKIMDLAATKFNIKPKSCREYLIAERYMQGLPSEFAAFIMNNQAKLSKKRIGEYIGSEDEYAQCVCSELFSFYRLQGDGLSVALRKLCRQIRLPGEAQQIGRILEKFSQLYHSQNEGVFASADTAFVLSYSIILLNTDLHNRSVAADKKMTLDQFIRNNRGIDLGQDLDPTLLAAVYADIRDNEILMSEGDMYEPDEVAFMVPTKTGPCHSVDYGLRCVIFYASTRRPPAQAVPHLFASLEAALVRAERRLPVLFPAPGRPQAALHHPAGQHAHWLRRRTHRVHHRQLQRPMRQVHQVPLGRDECVGRTPTLPAAGGQRGRERRLGQAVAGGDH